MSHIFNVRSFDPEIIIRAKAKINISVKRKRKTYRYKLNDHCLKISPKWLDPSVRLKHTKIRNKTSIKRE